MAGIWDNPAFGGGGFGSASSASPAGAGQNIVGNQFFDTGSTYGSTNGQSNGWFNTPLGGTLLEQNPDAAFAFGLGNLGIADNDLGFNKWAYNQLPRFQRGYKQATVINPLITMRDYMATLPTLEQLRAEYERQSPNARGERESVFAPGARVLTRG